LRATDHLKPSLQNPFEGNGRNEIGERENRPWFYASVDQGGYGGVNLISA
jgi:hypothetical protein